MNGSEHWEQELLSGVASIVLDDTTDCPRATRCFHCGTTEDLAVATFQTQVGVHCRTLCDTCAERTDAYPRLDLYAAMMLVLEHLKHLGITLEEMAAALDAERSA